VEDEEILRRIGELVDEEHSLEALHEGQERSAEDLERLKRLEVTLDQCWDLLRQRRARRAADQDPDRSEVRPARVVEGYRQ
jgi:Rad3-related DNA helicase